MNRIGCGGCDKKQEHKAIISLQNNLVDAGGVLLHILTLFYSLCVSSGRREMVYRCVESRCCGNVVHPLQQQKNNCIGTRFLTVCA